MSKFLEFDHEILPLITKRLCIDYFPIASIYGQRLCIGTKIILVRFIDINLVKNVINGVNLVKIGRFGENGQNWVILGPKWRHKPKFNPT